MLTNDPIVLSPCGHLTRPARTVVVVARSGVKFRLLIFLFLLLTKHHVRLLGCHQSGWGRLVKQVNLWLVVVVILMSTMVVLVAHSVGDFVDEMPHVGVNLDALLGLVDWLVHVDLATL